MKIKVKDVIKMADYYSETASKYNHHLGIAGIVIIWTLHLKDLDYRLLLGLALLLFIVTITISLLHYFLLAILAEKHFHKYQKKYYNEKGINELESLENEFAEENNFIEKSSWIFFVLKFIFMFTGYLTIFTFIVLNLFNEGL